MSFLVFSQIARAFFKTPKLTTFCTHHTHTQTSINPRPYWTDLDSWTPGLPRRMKRALSTCAVHMYSYAGLGITIRGRQARRADAPVLVVSPHSSFLDAVIIYLTGLASPLVRNADANLGSKLRCVVFRRVWMIL